MVEFKREARYHVIKVKDAHEYLTEETYDRLLDILDDVWLGRKRAGKPELKCVVVESDWPEYDVTWDSIRKRIEHESE